VEWGWGQKGNSLVNNGHNNKHANNKISSDSSLASQFNVTDEMRKMTLRDYFKQSKNHDETTDALTTKFPTKLIRRGSESDLRPMSMQNLFKSAHTLKVLPKPDTEMIVKQPQRSAMKFICGHPGCGQVFSSKQTAEMHQKQHKLRNRLAVPTPQIDQFLNSYWPKDIPWNKGAFVKLNTGPATIVCPMKGCRKTFNDPEAVKKHMRMGHSKGELLAFVEKASKETQDNTPHVEWIGNFKVSERIRGVVDDKNTSQYVSKLT